MYFCCEATYNNQGGQENFSYFLVSITRENKTLEGKEKSVILREISTIKEKLSEQLIDSHINKCGRLLFLTL